jgi:hypothetical protein
VSLYPNNSPEGQMEDLGRCPTCSGPLAAGAPSCPHCGYVRPKSRTGMTILMTLVFLAILLLAVVYFRGTIHG